MNVLGLIPARGGSKGIPGKNLRQLGGKPLLAYSAEAARASGVIDRLVLSTDSEAIAELGRQLEIEVPFLRPAALAQDDTPMLPVIQHAVGALEDSGWAPDIVVLLQPTSPLRRPAHIAEAVRRLWKEDCDSVVSVIEIPHIFSPQRALHAGEGYLRFWLPTEGITRRQQLETSFAQEGTLFAFRRNLVIEQGTIYGSKCLPLVLSPDEALNLDTEEDWLEAERIFAHMNEVRP